ncbi:MAG TPA: dipicolinate synthase subunit B [Candidatus Aphodomonas merdavium]|nr:dipicolinate synthase subunit B [Candidatus Aphodomonas merdavium]
MELTGKTVGFALTGSFCTFSRVFPQAQALKEAGARVIPIFSFNAWSLDTRFFPAEEVRRRMAEATGEEPLHTLQAVEPFGPQKLLDLLVIAPCTGNTLAKLAAGIADTPVTLAAKSHLRNERPLLLAVSTNDGLAAAARNIGSLLATRHYYFVPYGQDAPEGKPRSLVAHFEQIPACARLALEGRQAQPMLQ